MIPAILGALGQAAGGMGAAEVAGAVGAAQSATAGLDRLTPSLNMFASALTAIPAKVRHVKNVVTSTFDTFVQAVAAPMDAVKQLGDSISRYVRFSNPAMVELFNYRVENMFASLGRALQPILDALGRTADTVNLAFSKLGPSLDNAGDAVASIIDAISDEIIPVARELAPIIQTQAEVWRLLADVIRATAFPVVHLAEGLRRMGIEFGVLGGGFDENAQKTIAARRPDLSNSFEQIQRRAAQASILASTGAKKAETTEGWLEKIYSFLKDNLGADAFKLYFNLMGEIIKAALGENRRNAAAGAVGGAQNINLIRD